MGNIFKAIYCRTFFVCLIKEGFSKSFPSHLQGKDMAGCAVAP